MENNLITEVSNKPSSIGIGNGMDHASRMDRSRLPIFSQDWWLDIARGASRYRELRVLKGEVVVGRLPVVLSKNRLGLVLGHDPHWSHLGGPTVDETMTRAEQAEVIHSLLEQLPRSASFHFVCD